MRIKKQRLQDKECGSYWDWTDEHMPHLDEGGIKEDSRANPDILSDESESPFPQRGARELKAFQLLEDVISTLSFEMQEVWVRSMRNNESNQDIANVLDCDEKKVRRILRQAHAIVTDYLKAHEHELDEVGQ